MRCPECIQLQGEYHSALEIYALAIRAAGGAMDNLAVTNRRAGELYEACQAAHRRLEKHFEERHTRSPLGR